MAAPFPITIVPSARALRMYWVAPDAPNGIQRNASGTPVIAAIIAGNSGGGNSGGVSITELLAAVNLSGHRAVIPVAGGVGYPSLADRFDGDRVIGITQHAAMSGQAVTVQETGLMVEPTWNWTLGPVYAGDNGILTQIPPSNGWVREVGVAVAPQRIVVSMRPSIIRAN